MADGKSSERERFDKYWADVRARAATLGLVAVALILWSTSYKSGLGKQLLEAAGIALLTTGVVDLLVGGRLRGDLSRTILSAVGEEIKQVADLMTLAARLQATGVVNVYRTYPPWEEIFSHTTEIVLLPALGTMQPGREWDAALQAAAERSISIEIHIPAEESRNLGFLAERTGAEDVATLRSELHRLPAELTKQWLDERPKSAGELRIWTYHGVPGYSVVRTNNTIVISVPTLAGPKTRDRPRTMVFDVTREPSLAEWFQTQLDSVETGEYDRQVATE